ncbi:helix-turn-helix domain-containing protein [Listeria innocua]|uniref:helix-turn-helix domain-containing protein n=1 Tax=Listeria innocua TaxID=1642 RepID=UPI001627AA83|nr:helix-turn-helix domain-containing protein [Listeria innocua]MBC1925534.1 HTH domain-containing protein [Listeria innocua]
METFLLDKESKTILGIIEYLSATSGTAVSFSDLEDNLNINRATVKRYIQTLCDYCQEQQLDTFIVHKHTIKMSRDTNFNIFDLYHQMTQKAVKYQIMLHIFKNPRIIFIDLYSDLLMSKTSCYWHVKALNDFFTSYHCQLNFRQKNSVQGKEYQIRFLYYNLFWGLNLDKIIDDAPNLDQVLMSLFDFIPNLIYSTLQKIRLAFYIAQVRQKSGDFIMSEDMFISPDSPYLTYAVFFERLDSSSFLDNCPDVAIKHKEARYLYFLFCRFNLLTLDECEDVKLQLSVSDSPEIQYFLTQFQDRLPFKLTESELNFLSTNLVLFNQEAAIFRGRIKAFGEENWLLRTIRASQNTVAFIQTFLHDISEGNREIKNLIQNLPNLYQHYGLLVNTIIEKHHKPIKLLVQTNLSTLYRENLIVQIMNTVPFPISICTSEQLNGEKPDGIISDWIPEKKHQDIPFFSVSLFFTSWNKSELEDFLISLVDYKNQL